MAEIALHPLNQPNIPCRLKHRFDRRQLITEPKLSALEHQDSHLPQIKVDEMFGLMSHIASEISTDNYVPRWGIFAVEFLLDVSRNILEIIEMKAIR